MTGSSFRRFFAELDRSKQGLVDFLVGLNGRLQNEIAYQVRMKPGVQSPEETLSKRSGSCRDSAWLLCQLLRSCGIAARFVSGYLIQLKANDGADEQSAGSESDFADLHAWTEACICPERDGSDSIPHRVSLPVKVTFPWLARRNPPPLRQSPARQR